jgi:FkbM family methyltransferase
MPRLIRQFKDFRYRIFYGLLIRRNYKLATLGSRQNHCAWTFCPDGLNANSVIYSGGVGPDISFEHDLVRQFGCNIVLFDPSPPGLETMSKPENKIPQFKFHPVALAGRCGKLNFAPPLDPDGSSWFSNANETGALEVPCVDLSTLLQQNNHTSIDLLKIDIEGAEYDVLNDLLKRRLPVKQVLVEFHHGILPGIRRGQTIRAILKMLAAGYRLLDQEGGNHTFLSSRKRQDKIYGFGL